MNYSTVLAAQEVMRAYFKVYLLLVLFCCKVYFNILEYLENIVVYIEKIHTLNLSAALNMLVEW